MMEVLENVPGRKGGTSFGGVSLTLEFSPGVYVGNYMLVTTPPPFSGCQAPPGL